ncbi:endonuclease MutS2 [Herpetosiphon geysericola]|uniref:Endonuclease MutS2 n=1 Tax=Herpetosiphon geysericola TaxID=70996 RepID=A0A0N8GR49_9CHLR|nr:endonuclease MutS2 [Herpetosiphon geysericola]KPL85506.1 DNA mismatch repair protein MutS [Herpetosiphon geysericola]
MISEVVLQTLEFDKVRDQLARHAAFSASRELVAQLHPSTDGQWILQAQIRTSAARALIESFADVSIGGARDVRPAVEHARRGGILEASRVQEIASTLAAMRRLRGQVLRNHPDFVPLHPLAEQLPNLATLEHEIERTIGPDGEVLDSASAELGRLRSAIRVAFNRLQERLQAIINSSQYADVLQEPIITVRDGRYVVPVKAPQRRALRGIVHDQSSSGATLYIEPLATVELNNQWRELQLAEREEIQRILAALSGKIASEGMPIILGVEATAELDLAFAKAKYSISLRASQPLINAPAPADDLHPESTVSLLKARHPLLNQDLVVPTDVWLGGPTQMIIITGPNTGGKTVALKTVGLMALMAQAGLHIPAHQGSRLPIFGKIFADIGDEQSIEQSLSTFSSHMTNIIQILDRVTPDSLVLFDELGAGTDPVEGAALARAIIERLLNVGCLAMATSHYAELKAFAYSTDGVENASVEFDVETLSPTYRLSIGLPGRSNALAIAERLGLKRDLIERARATISRDNVQVEDLLAAIHRERSTAESEAARALELREDAELVRDRLSRELYEFEQDREQQLASYQRQLDEELREVRAELRRLRDEFRSVSVSRQWMEQAEQRLNRVTERVPQPPIPPKATTPVVPKVAIAPAPRTIQVGDQVFVSSVKLSGVVLDLDEEASEAEVQLGGFRLRVDLRELRLEKAGTAPTQAVQKYMPAQRMINTPPPPPNVSMQLDMRGWRASDVENQLDHYLNDAYLANLSEVRLVHGKGTGALRQVVRTLLKRHPLVESYNSGSQGEGGDGVTIAKMSTR